MNNPKAQFQIDNGNGWETIAEVDIINGIVNPPNAWTMVRAMHKQIVYTGYTPIKTTVAPTDSTPREIVDVMLGGWKKPITLDGKQIFISTEEQTPRDTHFSGFATALFQEIQADLTTLYVALGSGREQDITSTEQIIQQLIARRAYDLVLHTVWRTIPASGSSIKKYQGLTIEQIAAMIPDLPELPKEVQE